MLRVSPTARRPPRRPRRPPHCPPLRPRPQRRGQGATPARRLSREAAKAAWGVVAAMVTLGYFTPGTALRLPDAVAAGADSSLQIRR